MNAAGKIALAVLLAASADAFAGNLVIAERGKAAEYSIVIPAQAAPPQKYAAEELRDFIEKTTGVKLPIATDVAALPERAIVLEVADATP